MRIVSVLVAAAIFSVGISGNAEADFATQFAAFKVKYSRQYSSVEEEAKRLSIFTRNLKKAEQLSKTNPHAKFGVNEFADQSEEEFKVRHNSEAFYRKAVRERRSRASIPVSKFATNPSQDWRQHGAVTPVKNQGQCGSCWSFSTTGNVEGQWALAGNTLTSLSEQQLVSCDTTCNGCNGGLMDDAFQWIINANGGGLTTEAAFPYSSGGGVAPGCQTGFTNAAFITSYNDISHDEPSMASQVSGGGPLSIGVDATSWQTYQGGVLSDCTSNQVDHGVLIVGYDLSANPQYWIIKNSWGPSWGENGYIRVAYGSNQCLITTAPSTSVAASGPNPNPPSPPSPPSPPNPNPPSPPSPSTGTFTQYTCPYAGCSGGCQEYTFNTGTCIPTTSGGSAIATCGFELTMTIYQSSDCSGSYQQEQIPLDSCLQDTSGSYIYDVCNSGSGSGSSSAAVAETTQKLRLTK